LRTNETSRIWSNSHFHRVAFRCVFLEFDAFHCEQRVPVRRGRSRHQAKQSYIRFCFPDAATADAFRNRFGSVRAWSKGPLLRLVQLAFM
jgi:hypothetical protein